MFALADCNNFYVACERAFDPSLLKRPVVVLSSNDGCVISRSPEAKELGITMGMPLFQAHETIQKHNVAVFSSNYALYGSMSRRVMDVMPGYPVQREIYSIDEAFLQFPDSFSPDQLYDLCIDMRRRILEWTSIPVSIGIAKTKTIAKLASHLVKSTADISGVVSLVRQSDADAALELFPVGDVWGVGRNIERALCAKGVKTAAELRDADQFWLRTEYGVKGLALALELQGQVCHQLQLTPADRKEIIVSRTFGNRLRGYEQLAPAFSEFARRGAERLAAARLSARSVTAFVATDPFHSDSSGGTSVELELEIATANPAMLEHYVHEALKRIVAPDLEYKKGGIVFADLSPTRAIQDTLFNAAAGFAENMEGPVPEIVEFKIKDALAKIHEKYPDGIKRGFEPPQDLWEQRKEHMSPRYTTQWQEIPRI